jgi:hypothetical protein
MEQVYVRDIDRGKRCLYAVNRKNPVASLWEKMDWRFRPRKPTLWYQGQLYDGATLLKHMELTISSSTTENGRKQ